MADRILIVEDETSLRETLAYNLERQGYDVEAVGDGRVAIEKARQLKPDLIILDIMLPGLDGLEITQILRKEMNIPIMMLTAKDEEIDRVVGLEMGADDYVTKPFSMRELLARVKAVFRRIQLTRVEAVDYQKIKGDVIRFGNLEINSKRHEVSLNEEPIGLKPKEYDLLVYLSRNRGQVLSRDQILEEVWGWDFSGGTRTVDVHIRWLRSKIENDPANPVRIVTVRGTGYRFEG
jgi:DNA-binding response OmpR family regulator